MLPPHDKTSYQAELLYNRLVKRGRVLRKWARRNRLSCWRLYDRDIPEIPLAAELYTLLPDHVDSVEEAARYDLTSEDGEPYLCLSLYERPYEKPQDEEDAWLAAMAEAAARALGIPARNVITKTRRHQRGNSQYEKLAPARHVTGRVLEQGQLFIVNLTDYLDTGLFLDHRALRASVRACSAKKSVLNLYCYTGSFSVYAAEGGATRVESVDLSNTYLDWAKENMRLNGFSDRSRYTFTRADVTGFLDQKSAAAATELSRYDLIVLDPPTFSNSKAMRGALDLNRDWALLVNKCLSILKPGGTLYFSTNSRRLRFDEAAVLSSVNGQAVRSSDITGQTLSEDFRNARMHRCWRLHLADSAG